MANRQKRIFSIILCIAIFFSIGIVGLAAGEPTNWVHLKDVPDGVIKAQICIIDEYVDCDTVHWTTPDGKTFVTADISTVRLFWSLTEYTDLNIVEKNAPYAGNDQYYAELGNEGGGTLNIWIKANPNYAAPTFSVSYDANGGNQPTCPSPHTGLNSGDTQTLDSETTPARDADAANTYTFGGWADSPLSTTPITSMTIPSPGTNVIVYAIWIASPISNAAYSVTYYVDGIPVHTDSGIASGGSAVLWDGYSPPAGYTFSGWNKTAADLTNINSNIEVLGTTSLIIIPFNPTPTPTPAPTPEVGILGDQDKEEPAPTSDPSPEPVPAPEEAPAVLGESDKLPQTGGISLSTLLGFAGLALISGGMVVILTMKRKEQ
jgi:LPXTG-motif cell wall-anchored protein